MGFVQLIFYDGERCHFFKVLVLTSETRCHIFCVSAESDFVSKLHLDSQPLQSNGTRKLREHCPILCMYHTT